VTTNNNNNNNGNSCASGWLCEMCGIVFIKYRKKPLSNVRWEATRKLTRNRLPSINAQNVAVHSTVCGTRWRHMVRYRQLLSVRRDKKVHANRTPRVWVMCIFLLFLPDDFRINEFREHLFHEGNLMRGTKQKRACPNRPVGNRVKALGRGPVFEFESSL
jgi:hypothetical protein